MGSWVSCNFFCLVETYFWLGCNFFLSLSHTTQLYRHVLLLTGEHELGLQSRPLSTTIQEPAGISLELFIRCRLLNKDPLPVLPFNVIMILRKFRGAFGLLLGKLAGPPPLRYLQGSLTGWNLPRYKTPCSRKICLACSGLEWCASTEVVQHSLQRCAKP